MNRDRQIFEATRAAFKNAGVIAPGFIRAEQYLVKWCPILYIPAKNDWE